jgi:hypothetical protein
MNLDSANQVLADLEKQLKEAQERVTLLTGAIQGAKFILATLEEEAQPDTEQKTELKSIPVAANGTKRAKR